MARRNHPAWILAVTATVVLAGCGRTAQGSPSATSQPSGHVALASGSFTAHLGTWGETFDIEATGTGNDVSGTLGVSGPGGAFTVDLQCAQTADNGLLVISGAVTESTHEIAPVSRFVAILFAAGTPVRTLLWIDDEASPADSCPAFLAKIVSDPEFMAMTANDLRTVAGDLQLAL